MGAKLIGWKKKKGPTDKQLVHVHNIWMRQDGNKPREPRRCATQSLDRLSGNKLSLRLIKRMKHVNRTCQSTSVWTGPRPDKMSPSSNSRSSLIAQRFHRPIQVWFKSSLVGRLNIFLIPFFFCIVQTNRWWRGYPIEFAVWRECECLTLCGVRAIPAEHAEMDVCMCGRWLPRAKNTNILTNLAARPPRNRILTTTYGYAQTAGTCEGAHTCGGAHFLMCSRCCQIRSEASET